MTAPKEPMTTKQALLKLEDGIDEILWGNDPGFAEALSALTALANDYEKLKAENVSLSGNLAKALVENHAVALETEKNLRKKAEAELDGYEVRVALDAETIKLNFETIDKVRAELDAAMEVVGMAVESQGWAGNDPDEGRWKTFYEKARAAYRERKGEGKP